MSDEKSVQVAGVEIPITTLDKPRRSGKDLQAIADEMNIHPFEFLLHVIAGNHEALGYKKATREVTDSNGDKTEVPFLPIDLRVAAAKEAAQYLHPKKRAVEVSGNADADPINLKFEGTFLDLLKVARGES